MKKNGWLIVSIVFFALSIIFLIVSISVGDPAKRDFEKAQQSHTSEAYLRVIKKHGKSKYANIAQDSIVAIYSRYTIIQMYYRKSRIREAALKQKIDELVEKRVKEAYKNAEREGTIGAWQTYKQSVPSVFHRDADERIASLEEEFRWGRESSAWSVATQQNNVGAYEKYLNLYPHGKHARQAEQRLIDLEVAAVFAGEHGPMPAMEKVYSTGESYSTIEIDNKTQYELTISYSGPNSKRVVLQPWGTTSVQLGNGYYRVAAKCGHGATPYAGTETLDGSYYSVSYYIETYRRF